MRIATYVDGFPYYRVLEPLRAMERRGHEVLWLSGAAQLDTMASCDVVHVYRAAQEPTRRVCAALARNGTAITYDNDDDMAGLAASLPKGHPQYNTPTRKLGERLHAETVKMARIARVFTTPSEPLAQMYRDSGVERVEVIPNCLAPDTRRPRVRHDGIVIGWVAGPHHERDMTELKLDDVLRRLLAKHANLRVESIGVDFRLPEGYRHDEWVDFERLPHRLGAWDIGIAPLTDRPVNRARSDIKVKEYAASGVPWLASPAGPYAGLGEEQGGRLVPDDGWFEALDALVDSRRERKRLGRKGARWAKSQTIEVTAERWERVFLEAAGRIPAPGPIQPPR